MFKDSSELQEILYTEDGISKLVVKLIKNMMQELMKAELTETLGYTKHDHSGNNSGNSRNGYYTRDYQTRYGAIEDLKIPRDRNNEFEQKLIRPYTRREDWLETLIIKMYSRGMSTRDIAELIEKLYGSEYSATTISNITDVALEEVQAWHNRPLKKRYSILYIDGFSVKLRRDTVDNDSVYVVLGIDEDGYREILDFYIGTNESATVWTEVLSDLKNRGVQQVLLGVMDGLTGLKDSFLKVFPKADIQRCVVHKVRNSIHKIRKSDYAEFSQDLKQVYRSPTEAMASEMLDRFAEKWGHKYPKVVQSWYDDLPVLFTFYKYPSSIHQSIYTTNWIERTIKEIRRRTKTKDSLPTVNAAEKLIYLSVVKFNNKWSNRIMRGFKTAKDEILTMFDDRYGSES